MFLHKHNKTLYYTVPLLAILTLAFTTGFFSIDKKVINREQLWDVEGRPYETFLYELNLPSSLGAVFIAGTPDNPEKTEKYYYCTKVEVGDIFTNQLRSLLFGTRITEFSIASYINFIFGISSILFSLLVGYLIFKNGYVSIVVFLLIAIFRNCCPGLIYGLPSKYAYAVFNPLLVFCIVISIIMFFKSYSKKYWVISILAGFVIAYISHYRTSEGYMVVSSVILFTVVMFLENLRIRRENSKKILISILIMLVAMYAGYSGYYKMVTAFENHRDKKFNFTTTKEKILSAHPTFYILFISLFRYPNKFNYSFVESTGYDAAYKSYPELQNKFSDNVELALSKEYNKAIKELYLEFIFNNPKYFLTYLIRSAYDYFLFLPYYSWTGKASIHAYIPNISGDTKIEPSDLTHDPGFKNAPFYSSMILNLRLKYMPKSLLFWIYFACAYALFIEAIYTSLINVKKTHTEAALVNGITENNLPIYLLWGMLIYFFFTSIVRTLIPSHGQGAVVAFNMVVIYNLVRMAVSVGIIETRKISIPAIETRPITIPSIKIPAMEIPAIKRPAWLLLLIILSLSSLTARGLDFLRRPAPLNWEFERNTTGWNAYKSTLASVGGGQSGNCLQITITDINTIPSYAYAAVPTEVYKMYEVTAYFKAGMAPGGQIMVGTKIHAHDLYYSGILSDTDWTQYRAVFKATTTTTYITLVNLASARGLSCLFDTVTLTQAKTYETVR